MKLNAKRLLVILIAVFVGMVEVANAFYDPGLQRWINRDPLGDIASLPLTTHSASVPAQTDGDGTAIDGDFFNAWVGINQNNYGTMHNNLVSILDPLGLSPSLNPANQTAAAECMETAAQAGARKLVQDAAKKEAIKQAEKQAAKAAQELAKKIKKAEKMMRSDKNFREWIHREWKPKLPKGCGNNRDLTPEELAEALEHYLL